MAPPTTLYVFYDFVCPYCRISRDLVNRLVQEFPIVAVYKPFNFAPDIPADGEPWFLTKAEMQGFYDSVLEKSRQWHLDINIPPLRANSKLALKAAEYAREQGSFEVFQRKMFDAYWIDGKNIGTLRVVKEVAFSVGLDVQELEERLVDGTYDEVLRESQKELQQIKYVAIPTFVIGDYRVYGLQDYEVVRRAVELALTPRP